MYLPSPFLLYPEYPIYTQIVNTAPITNPIRNSCTLSRPCKNQIKAPPARLAPI